MGNVIANLPMPVLNGPGAAVDTSGMGRDKTLIVAGSFPGATVAIEASVDGGNNFAPVATFQTGDQRRVVALAAEFMRVNVTGRKASVAFSANADVGANDMGAQFLDFVFPAGNGAGAALNISALGTFSTFIVAGSFPGATVTIEVSEDGVDYAPLYTFAGYGGMVSRLVTGNFARVVVAGRKDTVAFSASASVGAINDPVSSTGTPTNWQSFTYTATGLEGQTFTVPIPVAQPNDTYQVRHQLGAVVREFGLNVLYATRAGNQFDVEVSTEPSLGDLIYFDVFNAPP